MKKTAWRKYLEDTKIGEKVVGGLRYSIHLQCDYDPCRDCCFGMCQMGKEKCDNGYTFLQRITNLQ